MPDISLDFRYLRYVLLVAQYGSFRAAAESENLSQSTVSRRVSIFERRVGVTLFERSHNGARLTAAGERFVHTAAHSAERLQEAIREVRQAVRGEAGCLRIGLMTSLVSGPLVEIIAQFHEANPKIELTFEETASDGAIASLRSRQMDAAFLPNVGKLAGCESMSLYEEDVYLAVSSGHPLATERCVSWEDVMGEEFLLPVGGAGGELDDLFLRRLAEGRTVLRRSMQYIGRDNLLNLVGRNCGVSLALESTAQTHRPDVVFLRLLGLSEKVKFSLVWSVLNQNPARQSFVETAANWVASRPSRGIAG